MAVSAIFGARVKRREDPRMITGQGRYTDDIKLSGMVYAMFLRSPYAHAKIVSINVEKARKVPGVIAVYTGKDLENKLGPVPCAWAIPNADLKVPKYMPLAVDRVRYVGDPVAVVVAESPYVARDALEQIEVEYERLPAVVNQEEAVKPEAPQLYDDVPNNIAFHWSISGGDVEKAFAEAEVVIKQRIINNRLQPTAIETRGAVAQYNQATGELTVWMTSQNPHIHRLLLAGIVGVPEHKLRVVAPDVGGGFGSKIHCYGGEAVVAFLAKELGRPVKWMEDRRENYLATIHGRDHIQYVELAAKRDGTILGLRVKAYANLGAYLSTASPGIPTILLGTMLSGCYKIPAISCEVYGVLTNTAPVDAYRGAGRPEASFIVERMVDILAHELGMDPAEVRRKNFIPPDAFPYTVATGLQYDSGNYEAALNKALELVGYQQLREEQKRLREQGRLIGIGISSYVEICGLGPSRVVRATGFGLGLWESAVVRVHPTGKVTVYTGGHPHGQGEETTFAQIVAEELGVPFEDVEVVHGDTAMIPFGTGTYGSRTTPVAGGAIAIACRRIKEKAKKIAAYLLEASEEDIEFERGKFYVKDAPERAKTIAEIALSSYLAGEGELPAGMEPGLESTAFYDPENFTFPFGTHVCVVEVDPETGEVHVKRYVAVDDCGRQINPMIVEGQVQGGVVQGMAQALWEEAVYDKDGNLLTATLSDYAVPTSADVPRIETSSTETPSPHNPLGVKGVGETGTIAATQAVVNAVVDALAHLGVRHIDPPLKAETVWRILKEKGIAK
ncbi:MAG: glyceraldehyde dehydrogenase subunit alpha [Aigarchaeota archaeon]|nr:glyceraldehyde dehydrogenase subunit alpha [Candidatus Pelearchaeum maunauluense]